MKIFLVGIAACLFFQSSTVSGNDGKILRGDKDKEAGNAALAYWQAQECLLAIIPDISDPSAAVPLFEILSNGHRAPLDADAVRAIDRSAMSLYFLRRGSHLDKCEWSLAMDELGPADEQGHLAAMPVLAGAACLRARYYFDQGQSREAAHDLIALLRLAKQAGNEGHDGTRGILSQLSAEAKVLEIAARNLSELNAADAQKLVDELPQIPTSEILNNLLAAQDKQWVQWSKKFSAHARRHNGDWASYWVAVGMHSDYRAEVGNLLRDAANGDPKQLQILADEAGDVFEQGRKLSGLETEEFRSAWLALLKKSAQENLIVQLAGGEVEPILDGLLVADRRRELFQAGILVERDGPVALSKIETPYGPIQFRKLNNGFELSYQRDSSGKLVFGQPEDDAGGR